MGAGAGGGCVISRGGGGCIGGAGTIVGCRCDEAVIDGDLDFLAYRRCGVEKKKDEPPRRAGKSWGKKKQKISKESLVADWWCYKHT